MDLPDFIRLGGTEPTRQFIVIGGYAVAAHGHTRATFDVDFMVRRQDREVWREKLNNAGMLLFGERTNFVQFTQPQSQGGDGLDLMLVDDVTFDQIWAASEERSFGGSTARVPCLDHLLALKLHALKQALPHRTSKDADDVEVLARRHKLNLRDGHYEALFLKYGTREIYETFLRLLQES